MDGQYKYSVFQRVLHWSIALMVIAMFPLGFIATDFDNKTMIEETWGAGSFNMLYDLHKSIGVTILALMVVRIIAAVLIPKPPYYPNLLPHERVGSAIVHGFLYLLLLLTPVLGWIGTSAYPAPVPFFDYFLMPALVGPDRALSGSALAAHGFVAIALLAFVSVHVLAGLFHGIVKRDGVIRRMLG